MIDYDYGVTLRTIGRDDLSTLRAWRNSPSIFRWCRQEDLISHHAHETWFSKQAQDPTIRMYVIMFGSEMVGVCGLTSIDLFNRRAEFSLYIAPDFHRRGLARKALRTLFSHGFLNYGLHIIWGETLDGNPAHKLFEEMGMNCTGKRAHFYYKDGTYWDAHIYSMTERDFFEISDEKWIA